MAVAGTGVLLPAAAASAAAGRAGVPQPQPRQTSPGTCADLTADLTSTVVAALKDLTAVPADQAGAAKNLSDAVEMSAAVKSLNCAAAPGGSGGSASGTGTTSGATSGGATDGTPTGAGGSAGDGSADGVSGGSTNGASGPGNLTQNNSTGAGTQPTSGLGGLTTLLPGSSVGGLTSTDPSSAVSGMTSDLPGGAPFAAAAPAHAEKPVHA